MKEKQTLQLREYGWPIAFITKRDGGYNIIKDQQNVFLTNEESIALARLILDTENSSYNNKA